MIDDSFRRLEEKITSNLEGFNKTINSYFSQSNEKVSELQSSVSTLKLNTESKIGDLMADMGRKISESSIKAALESA